MAKYFRQTVGDGPTPLVNPVDYIDFDTEYSPETQEGRMTWDVDAGTLQIGMPGGNVNLQIGQEMHARVKFDTYIQINSVGSTDEYVK